MTDGNGCLPRNGDADLCVPGYYEGVTNYFGREDWRYVHSHGQQGKARGGPASTMFPWAGQAVMKSGVGLNDTWARGAADCV